MVWYGWLSVSGFSFRPENSLPPPPSHPPRDLIGFGNGDQTIELYRLPIWPHFRRMVKRYQRVSRFGLWFFRNCSKKKPSGLFWLDLDWHLLLWIRAHGHGIITIFITYHLYPPSLSCSAFLPWFDQVLLDFAMFWIEYWIVSFFSMRTSAWKPSGMCQS